MTDVTAPVDVEGLVERMVSIADRDDTTGLAADALREGSEVLEAQATTIKQLEQRIEQGTFKCPICGKDTPHHHAPEEGGSD